jgi:hypothetical protein
MKLYVAGPMTGIPEKNFPAFAIATSRLRRKGYEVVSPAELDVDLPEGTWEACLKRDIARLIHCDGIAVLSGWERSRGANLEVHIGAQLGLNIKSVKYYLERRAK